MRNSFCFVRGSFEGFKVQSSAVWVVLLRGICCLQTTLFAFLSLTCPFRDSLNLLLFVPSRLFSDQSLAQGANKVFGHMRRPFS